MGVELVHEVAVSGAKDAAVSAHTRHIDTQAAHLDMLEAFLRGELLPSFVGTLDPLLRDQRILDHSRELAQHLDAEGVVRAVPLPFPLEITLVLVDVRHAYLAAPVLDLILDPLVIDLARIDDLLGFDVGSVERVQPELLETRGLHRLGSVAGGRIRVEHNQQPRVP